uniref:Uncharacterized protein n=1 Tax=Romanomermis culicivorax TaxID=13658 RepID=A0A915IX69_ROMCU
MVIKDLVSWKKNLSIRVNEPFIILNKGLTAILPHLSHKVLAHWRRCTTRKNKATSSVDYTHTNSRSYSPNNRC